MIGKVFQLKESEKSQYLKAVPSALSFIYIGEIYRDFVGHKRYWQLSQFAVAGQQQ